MTYNRPYRTAPYDRAVAALQALLKEEGPAQVYRACGDAVAYLERTFSVREAVTEAAPKQEQKERKLLLTQEEAAEQLCIGVTFFIAERNAGRIPVVSVGRRRLVPYAALVAYVRRICEEQGITVDEYTLGNWEQQPTRRTRGPNKHMEY